MDTYYTYYRKTIELTDAFSYINILSKSIKISLSYGIYYVSKTYDKFPVEKNYIYNVLLNKIIDKKTKELLIVYPYPVAYAMSYYDIYANLNKINCHCVILLQDGFSIANSCFTEYNYAIDDCGSLLNNLLFWLQSKTLCTYYKNDRILFSYIYNTISYDYCVYHDNYPPTYISNEIPFIDKRYIKEIRDHWTYTVDNRAEIFKYIPTCLLMGFTLYHIYGVCMA
jgi:hypothetical protein